MLSWPLRALMHAFLTGGVHDMLQPERVLALLEEHLRTALEREDANRDKLHQLRQGHKEAEAGLARLLELVEKGLMAADDGSLRERMVALSFRRDELAQELAGLTRRLSTAEPVITPERVDRLAQLLARRLGSDSPELRQVYVRLLLKEVRFTGSEIRIIGSKAILARGSSWGPRARQAGGSLFCSGRVQQVGFAAQRIALQTSRPINELNTVEKL